MIRHPICSAVVSSRVGSRTHPREIRRMRANGWRMPGGSSDGEPNLRLRRDMLHGCCPGAESVPRTPTTQKGPRTRVESPPRSRSGETSRRESGATRGRSQGIRASVSKPRAYADEPGVRRARPAGLFHPDGAGALETEEDDEGWRRRRLSRRRWGGVGGCGSGKNEACMLSLAVDKIRSLPKYDACFMFSEGGCGGGGVRVDGGVGVDREPRCSVNRVPRVGRV